MAIFCGYWTVLFMVFWTHIGPKGLGLSNFTIEPLPFFLLCLIWLIFSFEKTANLVFHPLPKEHRVSFETIKYFSSLTKSLDKIINHTYNNNQTREKRKSGCRNTYTCGIIYRTRGFYFICRGICRALLITELIVISGTREPRAREILLIEDAVATKQ